MWAARSASSCASIALALAALAGCGSEAPRASGQGTGTGTGTEGASVIGATTDTAGAGACDDTGVDAVLSQVGYLKTVTLAYVHAASSGFAAGGSDVCPLSNLGGGATSDATIVLRNTSGQAAYLEASAECALGDDAFVAVYAGTTIVPASDADRMACTGFVANGSAGPGAFTSGEASGSARCPGLTVANSGAVRLAPCETAVVVVQPGAAPGARPVALDLQLAAP